jgi:hypothetical protein
MRTALRIGYKKGLFLIPTSPKNLGKNKKKCPEKLPGAFSDWGSGLSFGSSLSSGPKASAI